MAKPAPRSNFVQTLLLAVAIFLLLQLFLGNRGNSETRTSDQILTSIKTLHAKVEDPLQRNATVHNIQGERGKLDQRIKEELAVNQITAEQASQKRLQAMVLVGDALYRAGTLNQDLGPLTQAYYMLHGERGHWDPKRWETESVPLTISNSFPEPSRTPKQTYDAIIKELEVQSKNHLILGFLPGYRIIDTMVGLTGKVPSFSYPFAAFLLALLVRSMIWPLAQRQYMWGRQMARLQPLVAELKVRFKDKKTGQITNMQELQKKTMELYKEYGMNPMSGCLPALIQVPYFILIYQCMLSYRFEFQKGMFAWINPAVSSATGGFIAPNLGERDFILIGIYAVSMLVTTLLTPVSDPANQRQQRLMGVAVAVIFSISMFFYPLPSAFVLYWVFTNIFATIQMLRAYRMPLPPLVKVNAPGGGVYPADPFKPNGQSSKTGVPVKHKPKKKK
jgi:YidC/Oxa1 family membrane protein insertase